MARHKRTKKQFIKLITQYGIHIWAILIIANAAMVYAYQFATHAANKSDTTLHTLDISQSPSPSVSPSPSSEPLGPSINLTFTVPGIGSGGGVMKPIHLKRNVTVFLYAPDVNSLDPTVKPLYTIQNVALFDSDPFSPTYTSFVSPVIDLGSDVKDGNYQIAFRTDQSLRTIVKQNPTDLGGEIFNLTKNSDPLQIPSQTVLMGDVIPFQGDNAININDYNAFITCFGALNTTNSFCKSGNFGDFNDDGVIDGIDYNILIRSLNVLAQEGLAIPKVSPTPSLPKKVTTVVHLVTPTISVKEIVPTPHASTTTSKTSHGGPLIGALLFVFFLIILCAVGFVLYLKNEFVHNIIRSLIHLSPTGTPATQTMESTSQIANEQDTSAAQTDETSDQKAAKPAATPAPPAAGNAIEKDCYIKTKGKDEAGIGQLLLLTDDNGAVNAHYTKGDATDGFAKVKGVMKEENGKKFLEISELTMEG